MIWCICRIRITISCGLPEGTVPDTSKRKIELTAENIRAINAVLSRDQRVELIPTKDGVRVIHVRREEVKTQ